MGAKNCGKWRGTPSPICTSYASSHAGNNVGVDVPGLHCYIPFLFRTIFCTHLSHYIRWFPYQFFLFCIVGACSATYFDKENIVHILQAYLTYEQDPSLQYQENSDLLHQVIQHQILLLGDQLLPLLSHSNRQNQYEQF